MCPFDKHTRPQQLPTCLTLGTALLPQCWPAAGLAGHTSRVAELLEQVQKLSVGDIIATHRDLYLRNVSSCELSADADVPEPERHEGEVVKFDRWASQEIQAVAGQNAVR